MSGFVPTSESPPRTRSGVGVLESPEEVLTTLRADGRRTWMYPTETRGRFWKRRLVLGWALIALFVALPIVRIGGKPAVLLDVAAREFTLFGFTFYPTDTFLLLLVGIASLLAIVLLTALLGRVWCGWGCPQTVYLEFVYRPLERLIEGTERQRKKRDDGAWTGEKVRRKMAKWAAFGVVSVALAHVFVSYFVGWADLLRWMTGPPTEHWGYFVLMAATSGLILFDFGVFREQMCTITCPYARMQSVLMDEESMIVSYDPGRGEPRGRGKTREAKDGTPLGDCVDCFACVRTCPTGIDIRDGLQMECIACTQCIDACDAIMDRTGQPRGLIRYTSENELDGLPSRWLRPRTAIYGLLLVALTVVFTVAVTTRDAVDVNVGRSVGAPFLELEDGTVANRLGFRLRNQTATAAEVRIEVVAPEGAVFRPMGRQPIALAPQQMARLDAFVTVPRAAFDGATQTEATFQIVRADGDADGSVLETLTFPLLGPSD